MLPPLLSSLLFCALLCWAAFSDVRTMLIPNRIPLLLAGSFPLAALWCGMPVSTIGLHLLCGLIALGLCFLMFQRGVMGGGDAKLIAAATLWTGVAAIAPFLFGMCLAGGLLALALILGRKAAAAGMPAPGMFQRLLLQETHAPYAVAIAAGGLYAAARLPFFTL